jgi:hypothetical protein
MLKSKILPVLSGLILSCTLVFGQTDYKPGYIIGNNNDTIRGYINLRPNNINCKECDFTTDKTAPARTYYPGNIKAYRVEDSKYYVSREVSVDTVPAKFFLEYLVDGIVDLFYLKLGEEDYYFLEKNGEMYRLSNEAKTVKYTPSSSTEAMRYGAEETFVQHSNQYIGMLSIAFADCADLKKEINQTAFGYNQLIKVTRDYHNKMCSDYQCIDYSKSTKGKVYFEPYAGVIYSRLGLLTSKQYVNNTNYLVGFNIRLLPVKSHYLWNLIVGVNYSRNSLEKKFYHDLKSSDYINPVLIKADYSILRIPISIEYTFPTGKLRPFVMATYTNSFLLNETSQVRPVYEYPNGGTSDIGVPYDDEIETFDYGLGGGFGLKYSNGDNGYGFLKCEYEYRLSYVSSNQMSDNLNANSIIFSVGYGFRV